MKRYPGLVFVLLLLAYPFSAQGRRGMTTRVSVATGGGQGDNGALYPSISGGGRFIAFESHATNLVPGDTNDSDDVFVHDRHLGVTTRVSVATGGGQGNDRSVGPSISADGRFVAFLSAATNLVSGDTNDCDDVFVHDRQLGVTTRVSVSTGGGQSGGWSGYPSISHDGRFVAFDSSAPNLVPGDTNDSDDVFVHDRHLGATTRVSVSTGGGQGNSWCYDPSISADGRFVAFESWASNLVPGDNNGAYDVFVHDRHMGITTRVSVATGGGQASGHSYDPSISADGQFVAFMSGAEKLVPGDTNGAYDVFIHDRHLTTTTRVSVATRGGQGNDGSFGPSIGADGRYVAFESQASNLVPGDTNSRADVFVYDRQLTTTTRVSVSTGGGQGNSDSHRPSISSDGRFVAFYSHATNLVPGDNNNYPDSFVQDRFIVVPPPPGSDRAIPTVRITITPFIAKDATNNDRWTIFLGTEHTVVTDNGQVTVTLDGLRNRQGLPVVLSKVAARITPRLSWKFDLDQLDVPRFDGPVRVTAVASVTDSGQAGTSDRRSMPEIRLPVVVLHGIKMPLWGDGVDQQFVSGLEAYGYTRLQPYPTLFPDVPAYDPTLQTLDDSAASLFTFLLGSSGPLGGATYAGKVDLVAHSKGGLVARTLLARFTPMESRVRRLVMACTPHTGAASASLLPMTNPIVELLPTHDWYRDGHATAFYQARNNATLKNLNLTPMPQEVEYHLLYGTGVLGQAPTPANYTAGPVPWFNTNVGDGGALGTPFGVLSFSALGYEVINLNNPGGDSVIGTRIQAFDPTWGGKAPKSERGLPLAHSRFLGNAVDVIHGLLAAP